MTILATLSIGLVAVILNEVVLVATESWGRWQIDLFYLIGFLTILLFVSYKLEEGR